MMWFYCNCTIFFPSIWCGFIVIVQFTIKSHQIDVIIMLNDGISIGAIVAVNLHDNHIISHCILVSYSKVSSAVAVNLHGNHIISHSNFTVHSLKHFSAKILYQNVGKGVFYSFIDLNNRRISSLVSIFLRANTRIASVISCDAQIMYK